MTQQVAKSTYMMFLFVMYGVIFIATIGAAVTIVPAFLGFESGVWLVWILFVFSVAALIIADILADYHWFPVDLVDKIILGTLLLISILSSGLALVRGFTMVPTMAVGLLMAILYKIKGPLISGIGSIFAGTILMFLGFALNIFSSPLIGPYPPSLLTVIGVSLASYDVIKRAGHQFAQGYGGAGSGPSDTTITIISLSFVFILTMSTFYLFVLQGDWDNTEAVSGEVLHGVGSAVSGAAGFAGDQIEGYTNVQLNPSRNPTFARMTCTMSIYFGGGVIGETNPDQLIANCVDDKLGRNETEAESDRVTEPVRIQVQDIELEPYSDRVNVVVPILNNLVRDINGRSINVDAREIRVNIKMTRNGETVASRSKAGEIEPIEQLASGGDALIEHSFPTFAIVGTVTDARIEQWLLRLQECHQNNEGEDDGEDGDSGSSCESQLNQFLNRFDNGDLSKARVAYVNRVRVGIPSASAKSYGLVEDVADDAESDLIPTDVWNRENNIAPDREYTVVADVQYKFAAEAAFTQASRWRSGNYLLELWDPNAWDELSFEAREDWESQNCNALTRYGQEVERQRTAALTTPVVPVMYTECGNTLFRQDNYYEDLRINVGATVHPEYSDGLKEDRGFKINSANTDCGGGDGDVKNDIGGDTNEEGWYVHQEEVGFVVEPANVTRSISSIAGDTMTIGCRTTMDFTVNFEEQTTYEVPNLQ